MRVSSGVQEGGSPLMTACGGRQVLILWMTASVLGAVVDCGMRSGEARKKRATATILRMDIGVLRVRIRLRPDESSVFGVVPVRCAMRFQGFVCGWCSGLPRT